MKESRLLMLLTCFFVVSFMFGCSNLAGMKIFQGNATNSTATNNEVPAKTAASAESSGQPAKPSPQKKVVTNKPVAPGADKYCDSLEGSYSATDNVKGVLMEMVSSGSILDQLKGTKNLEDQVKEISKKYLWLPLPIERSIGEQLHAKFLGNNQVVEKDSKVEKALYEKVEGALAVAKRDYQIMPYEAKLSIVESNELNAEALPGGYIYVHKRAAEELEPETLQLVLGHELAHIAKRHLSMQLQQRIVDIGMGKELFEKMMKGTGPNDLVKMFQGEHVLQRFLNNFASYVRDQELQADACAIREMVYADGNPIAARDEYLSKRGTSTAKNPSNKFTKNILKIDLTKHPDDATRDSFFKEAKDYHVGARRQLTSR
jgi:Peptidase family M48